jgi:hypothetical protein
MAVITSPDNVVSVTVTVGNPEPDGVYPITITSVTPAGQQFAIEYNGTRVYDDVAGPGSGSQG